MEASLPAITPAPVPPPKSPAQKSPATETASPFSDFLDAATADNAPQDAQESVDPEISANQVLYSFQSRSTVELRLECDLDCTSTGSLVTLWVKLGEASASASAVR
jgi:hypothetical protein